MWPFAVGKGEVALATLVRGTRSISTIYEVQKNGHHRTGSGVARHGKPWKIPSGILTEHPCRLACGAVISPYMPLRDAQGSNGSASLKQELSQTWFFLRSLPAGIPIGCFHSSGVQFVSLPKGTTFIGHKAFAHCKQLVKVDLADASRHVAQGTCKFLRTVSI